MAGVNPGFLYQATGDGAVLNEANTGAGAKAYAAVATSADGLRVAAAANGDFIYTSVDGGKT